MLFTFETTYDQKTMKTLAMGLRKTLRAEKSKKAHILGTIIIILGAALIVSKEVFDFNSALTAIAVLAILYVFLQEDDLNGKIAKKRGLHGLESSVTTFCEENYHSVTELGETTFSYDNILAIAETEDYFLLLFSPSHGQIYAKKGMTGGTAEEFRAFLEGKTNLTIYNL